MLAHVERKHRARARLVRVDVEARPDLAERFRVSAVPAVVLVQDKRVVGRLDGRVSAPRIERLLERHAAERERQRAPA